MSNSRSPVPLFAELVARLKEAHAFISSCGGGSARRLLEKIRATLKRAREEKDKP